MPAVYFTYDHRLISGLKLDYLDPPVRNRTPTTSALMRVGAKGGDTSVIGQGVD